MSPERRFRLERLPQVFILVLSAILTAGVFSLRGGEGIPVKVVVVTMFEIGEDQGDKPGEFQYWVERLKLEQKISLPAAYRDPRTNGQGVVALVTGMGTARAAASIMALGSDSRFDFGKTYWLVAGIAGIDPADGSIGSAVWADYVVDGDLAHEIDAREIPKDWDTGYLPLFKSKPYEGPPAKGEGEVYALNAGLADWAYKLTKNVPLVEDEAMKKNRVRYGRQAKAQGPPKVLIGATLSGGTFWHGQKMNRWANDWVSYWTGGKGNYTTTAMEDSGTLQALTFLAKAGRVDLNRVMVLRTASNFDMQPDGMSAAQSLAEEKEGTYSAFLPSLEAAFRVGSTVVEEITGHWSRYENGVPGAR